MVPLGSQQVVEKERLARLIRNLMFKDFLFIKMSYFVKLIMWQKLCMIGKQVGLLQATKFFLVFNVIPYHGLKLLKPLDKLK